MLFELLFLAGLGLAFRAVAAPARRRGSREGLIMTGTAAPTDSMDGLEIANAISPTAGSVREDQILALAQTGQIPTPELVSVVFQKGGHTVEIFAAKDALMLGTTNPVRLNAQHGTAQRLADYFGMVLPTSLMSDQAWLASSRISPHDGLSGPHMADTATMVEHSRRVDADIAESGFQGALVRPVGKDWVNTERLLEPDGTVAKAKEAPSSDAVANFGWHSRARGQSRSPGGQPVLQSVGLVHALPHTDYSQVVTLYGPTVVIDDGAPEWVEDVLRDPSRAYLLSDEVSEGRAARVTRHPDYPVGGIA